MFWIFPVIQLLPGLQAGDNIEALARPTYLCGNTFSGR